VDDPGRPTVPAGRRRHAIRQPFGELLPWTDGYSGVGFSFFQKTTITVKRAPLFDLVQDGE
jgi:hypothetical protein